MSNVDTKCVKISPNRFKNKRFILSFILIHIASSNERSAKSIGTNKQTIKYNAYYRRRYTVLVLGRYGHLHVGSNR